MTEQRTELMYERCELPSRFWEPQPDEEDLKRMAAEAEPMDDEELPFE